MRFPRSKLTSSQWRWFAIVAALVVNVTVWGYWYSESQTWDPLGEYPVQEVHSRVPNVDGPAVSLTGNVELRSTGTKCNDWPEPVDILGYLRWVRIEPRGLEIVTFNGIEDTREPGCETFMFSNPLPDGLTEGVWQIRGREVPQREARNGVPRRIQSQNFTVVP